MEIIERVQLENWDKKVLCLFKIRKDKKQLLKEKEALKVLTKFIMEKNERNRLKKLKGDQPLVLN